MNTRWEIWNARPASLSWMPVSLLLSHSTWANSSADRTGERSPEFSRPVTKRSPEFNCPVTKFLGPLGERCHWQSQPLTTWANLLAEMIDGLRYIHSLTCFIFCFLEISKDVIAPFLISSCKRKKNHHA